MREVFEAFVFNPFVLRFQVLGASIAAAVSVQWISMNEYIKARLCRQWQLYVAAHEGGKAAHEGGKAAKDAESVAKAAEQREIAVAHQTVKAARDAERASPHD